jgi:hypothetical protein
VADPPSESTTVTVMVEFPAVEGVQVISADELELQPAGSPDQE